MQPQELQRYWVGAFIRNVMQVSRVIPFRFVADRQRLTSARLDELLSHNGWLTRQTADKYNAAAFDFLSPDELNALTVAVAQVRAVADQLGPNEAASAEQADRARPAFKQILTLLELDRFDDPDAFILGKAIERRLSVIWPSHLDHLRFRTGLDSTDDPALWVWAFVKETGEHDEQAFFKGVDEIEPLLKPVAREAAPEGRVYLRFRSTLDQPEAEEVAA